MSSESHIYEQLYRETIPSVVSIYTNPGHDRRGPPRGAGSGFVYDTAHIVTNQHVVATSQTVEARFSEDDWRTDRVVGTDAYTDLAVVRVNDLPDYAEPLTVATENPTPGQAVAALGNPIGLDGTITTGIVSGTNRSMRTTRNFTIPETDDARDRFRPLIRGAVRTALLESGIDPDDPSTHTPENSPTMADVRSIAEEIAQNPREYAQTEVEGEGNRREHRGVHAPVTKL